MAWMWISPEKHKRGGNVSRGGYRTEIEAKKAAIIRASHRPVARLDDALVESLWRSLASGGWRVELEL